MAFKGFDILGAATSFMLRAKSDKEVAIALVREDADIFVYQEDVILFIESYVFRDGKWYEI